MCALKVGVSIAHDLHELLNIQHFVPRAFHEITLITRQLAHVPRRTSGTGGTLAQAIQMAESTRQKKMTNWEKHHLTFPERRYAATDAWIALELFTVVSKCRKRQEQNVPTLPENYSIQALQARKR
jgi:hypothetical protein